jgi:hypothetical protein
MGVVPVPAGCSPALIRSVNVPFSADLLVDLYDLYLRAAVELRQITLVELDELRHMRRLFGVHTTDLAQIREALVTRN